jgi:Flp pilus assembly pilin Flp
MGRGGEANLLQTDRLRRRLQLSALLPEWDDGQSLAEYALILALIALLALGALTTMGTSIATILRTIAQRLVGTA